MSNNCYTEAVPEYLWQSGWELTGEAKLFELLLVSDRTICDTIYKWAKYRTTTCFIDAEKVRTRRGGCWRVVGVRVGKRK